MRCACPDLTVVALLAEDRLDRAEEGWCCPARVNWTKPVPRPSDPGGTAVSWCVDSWMSLRGRVSHLERRCLVLLWRACGDVGCIMENREREVRGWSCEPGCKRTPGLNLQLVWGNRSTLGT